MDLWIPRTDKHPQFTHTELANIVPMQIRIHAQCLVLLYSQQKTAALQFNPEEQKILNGMLGVLELPSQQIMTAVISAPWPQTSSIELQIQQWQPKYILQLDMLMPKLKSINCIQTYSPGYLLMNPQFKAAAYKNLLTLRAMLHGTAKRNS